MYQYKVWAAVNTGAFTIRKEFYHIFQQPQKRASCVPCGMRAILSHVTWAKEVSGLARDARLRAHSHSTQHPLRSCLLQSCAPFPLKLSCLTSLRIQVQILDTIVTPSSRVYTYFWLLYFSSHWTLN